MEPDQNKPVFGPIFVDLSEPGPPGTSSPSVSATAPFPSKPPLPRDDPKIKVQSSLKGIENAKKRLRAFSIQKKLPSVPSMSTAATSSPKSGSGPPVIIGKNIVKAFPARPIIKAIPYEGEDKKVPIPPPKPPRPGTMDSYSDLKKKTLTEIEDMKRKIELVELGIPLGLICPASNSPASKAMPTKAMPPIKSFLAPEKLDEIICEAKKAKAEGREFKFDYSKLLPQYDNPFQRKNFGKEKKDDKSQERDERSFSKDNKYDKPKSDRDRRKIVSRFDKYDTRKHSSYRKDDRDRKYRDRDERSKDNKEGDAKSKTKEGDTTILGKGVEEESSNDKPVKETDLNLNDYLVCDSWSLDNDDKTDTSSPKVLEVKKNIPSPKVVEVKKSISSPKVIEVKKGISSPKVVEVKKTDSEEKKETKIEIVFKDPMEQLRESILKKKLLIDKNVLEIEQEEIYITKPVIDDIPLPVAQPVSEIPLPKIERLKPVVDSFTYEIEPDDDIFYEDITVENFCQPIKPKLYDQDSQDACKDEYNNEDFLESVINEIKQENMSDDMSQDKGLVEYDMSPEKNEDYFGTPEKSLQNSRSSVTPELDDKMIANTSARSSESGIKSTESGYRSTESGYKSTESGYKSTESGYKSTESVKSVESSATPASFRENEGSAAKATEDSLDTWSFVMKICQPLLFRHDRNKCYRETKQTPKLWYTENPKLCDCVQDRSIVYEELETCKMSIVDKLYQCSQLSEAVGVKVRDWYATENGSLTESKTINLSNEWESEDSANNEQKDENVALDTEYQRFMESVWPEVAESKIESGGVTPTKEKKRKKKMEGDGKKSKKMKLNSWSQESEAEEVEKSKKSKMESKKEKRKRKRVASSDSDSSEHDARKSKKKSTKKKDTKKTKKSVKRRRMEKKYLKKLKEKQKAKSKKAKEKAEKMEIEGDKEEEKEKERPKKQSKTKKKSQSKNKKKESKKRKKEKSSSSSSSDSDSDTDSSRERRLRKKKKDRKRKSGDSSEARQDELFDVNVLNNIKTEKGTDDEVTNRKKKTEEMQDFSPRRQPHKPRKEIINMNQLQNDFVNKNMNIKQESAESPKVQEISEVSNKESPVPSSEDAVSNKEDSVSNKEVVKDSAVAKNADKDKESRANDFDEESRGDDKPTPENTQQTSNSSSETSQSQDSSQDSSGSPKQSYEKVTGYEKELTSYERDIERYEKDTSHLRPSSQNSNYSFNDVISASHSLGYQKEMGDVVGNYEMYEQMAMEYMSGAANQELSASPQREGNQKIETVVSTLGSRGEIKCDWRPGLPLTRPPSRPSRWGLKPGEANIVLTGRSPHAQEHTYPIRSVLEDNKTYQIQSITDSGSVYDEAYADMYGALDRLQYGDCFSQSEHRMGQQFGQRNDQRADQHSQDMTSSEEVDRRSSLDKRIDKVLGKSEEVVKEEEESQDRGILLTKPAAVASKSGKRVSFADGYKPGQDSDDEAPPPKKKRSRYGAAWPVAASHADHVPLWDALPPPPPPPGSPPPAPPPAPPLHLLRLRRGAGPARVHMPSFDACPAGMLASPPPGLLPLPRALL